MKRPQSAKPGYRSSAMQNSADQIKEQDIHYRQNSRKQVKLMKPDLTTNDFARIMPKKIFQDKERLYSQGLQLKQKLNEYQEENTRLKTRISILEKEKDKLSKVIDAAADPSTKSQNKFKMYQGPTKPSDVQGTRIRNLTKIIRQSKEQNEYLRQQNTKIKKAVKFTKINEVEIECKILREEYQKLQEILVGLNQKLAQQDDYQRQINQLKNYLQNQVEQNKQLSEANQKYVQYIQELQQKTRKQNQKFKQKEIKYQREVALHKRKLNEAIRVSDDLRKELRTVKEANQNLEAKKKQAGRPITRPMTSNPYKSQNKQQNNGQERKKIEDLKKKNESLEKELKQLKQKLQNGEKSHQEQSKGKKQNNQKQEKDEHNEKQKQKQKQKENNDQLRLDSQPKNDYQDEDFDQEFVLSPKKQQESLNKSAGNNKGFVLKPQNIDQNSRQYTQQFQQQSPKKKTNQNEQIDKSNKNKHETQEQEAQSKKEKERTKSKNKDKTEKKKKEEKPNNPNYEPDKKMLTDIKQLLTYRMKAQRYPFEDLKNDIIASNQSAFSYNDLENMLKTEPFYLTPSYTKPFLEYVFERKDKGITQQSVTSEVLLNKLRKVIKNFDLIDQKEEQQQLMSIAEMTTQYPNQLQNAFEKIKNGPDTVSIKDLRQMFKKLELADHFIEIIIAQLSLCSEDLEHLSIRGYFERFYIDELQNSNAIDQQQIESSGQQKPNSGQKKNKIHRIEEQQYQDDKVNFIMQDEGELSMKGKLKDVDYNDDLVSDDGHI